LIFVIFIILNHVDRRYVKRFI